MLKLRAYIRDNIVRERRPFLLAYVLAFLVLLIFIVCSHLAFVSAVRHSERDLDVVRLAGLQQTLAQKILYVSTQLRADPDNAEIKEKLSNLIDRFEDGHQTLVGKDGGAGPIITISNRTQPIFFQSQNGKPSLDAEMHSFVTDARWMMLSSGKSGMRAAERVKERGETALPDLLEHANAALVQDMADRKRRLQDAVNIAFVGAILILIAEAIFIFLPAHLAANASRRRLEERAKEQFDANERLETALNEARKASVEATRSNYAKSLFLANMSHELRTPLNAIIGFSSMMRDQIFGALGHDKYREYANDIEQSGSHLLDLMKDLMDLSQIEVGQTEIANETLSPKKLLKSVQTIINGWPSARNRNISFHDENAPEVMVGDETRLRQILINLVSNAVKFTNSDDAISVLVQHDGADGVIFVVEDRGPGFQVEYLAGLTQPFQRGDNALVRHCEGSGLGLSLVSGFAQLHGGKLVLENAQPKGAKAIVHLPGATRMVQCAA